MRIDLGAIIEEQKHYLKSIAISYLVHAIDGKDHYTGGHSVRVGAYCEAIAKALMYNESRQRIARLTGLFHDIGKIEIEDIVLTKEAKLTFNEWKSMKRHPEHGYRIIMQQDFPGKRKVARGVLEHHERFDGKVDTKHSSYLGQRKGKALSPFARITHVTDSYDAMRTDRPYRPALSQKEALDELLKGSGTEFDPRIVNVFIKNKIYEMEDLFKKDDVSIH